MRLYHRLINHIQQEGAKGRWVAYFTVPAFMMGQDKYNPVDALAWMKGRLVYVGKFRDDQVQVDYRRRKIRVTWWPKGAEHGEPGSMASWSQKHGTSAGARSRKSSSSQPKKKVSFMLP